MVTKGFKNIINMSKKILIRISWTVALSNAFPSTSVPFAARTTLAAPRPLFVTVFEYAFSNPFINLSKLLTTRYNSASTRKVVVIDIELGDSKLDPRFVSGFIDGEGCFTISFVKYKKMKTGWRVMPVFEIELHGWELPLLEKIKAFFKGAGVISKTKRITCKYRVSSVEQISKIIIPHFEKYPLITIKRADYLLFKEVIGFSINKEHLTIKGIRKTVALKAAMNRGLSYKLKIAFTDIVPVERPLVELPQTIDPYWLAGFTSAEGCFNVHLTPSQTHSVGFQVILVFILVQHERDEQLMICIMEFLGCGNL